MSTNRPQSFSWAAALAARVTTTCKTKSLTSTLASFTFVYSASSASAAACSPCAACKVVAKPATTRTKRWSSRSWVNTCIPGELESASPGKTAPVSE